MFSLRSLSDLLAVFEAEPAVIFSGLTIWFSKFLIGDMFEVWIIDKGVESLLLFSSPSSYEIF